MIKFGIRGAREFTYGAQKYAVTAGLRAMGKAVADLKEYIVSYKLQGHPLYSRTGGLAESIEGKTYARGDGIIGIIGTDVRWARVHELGAIITPKTQPYLRFRMIERGTGKDLGWKTVRSVRIPRRPVFKPAVQEKKGRINYLLTHNFLLEIRREILREMRGARFDWGKYGA